MKSANKLDGIPIQTSLLEKHRRAGLLLIRGLSNIEERSHLQLIILVLNNSNNKDSRVTAYIQMQSEISSITSKISETKL